MGNPFISSQMSSQKAHFVLKDHSDICTFLSACTPVHIIGQNKEHNYIKKVSGLCFIIEKCVDSVLSPAT